MRAGNLGGKGRPGPDHGKSSRGEIVWHGDLILFLLLTICLTLDNSLRFCLNLCLNVLI